MNRPVGLTLILLALHTPADNAEVMDRQGLEPWADRL